MWRVARVLPVQWPSATVGGKERPAAATCICRIRNQIRQPKGGGERKDDTDAGSRVCSSLSRRGEITYVIDASTSDLFQGDTGFLLFVLLLLLILFIILILILIFVFFAGLARCAKYSR